MRKVILSLVCVIALLSACEKVVLNTPSSTSFNALKATDSTLIPPPIDTTTVVPPVVVAPYVKPPIVVPPIVVPPYVIKTPVMIAPVVVPPYAVPPVVSQPPIANPPFVLPPTVVPPVVKPPVVIPPVVIPPVVKPPVVVPPIVGLSFASDVVPVLTMCEGCHTHGWTPSTVASTYYTNLVNAGYVNVSAYTSSNIYGGINNGHFGSFIPTTSSAKIITWMQQGSKNN